MSEQARKMKAGDEILYLEQDGRVYEGIVDEYPVQGWMVDVVRLRLDRRVAPTPVVLRKDVFGRKNYFALLRALYSIADTVQASITKYEDEEQEAKYLEGKEDEPAKGGDA